MRKVLWGCIVANAIYSLAQYTDIVTPAYIIVLLLLIILNAKGERKTTITLMIVTAIIGILLTIIGMGNLMIVVSGIALILGVINESFKEQNQKKYDADMGINGINERVEEKEVKIVGKYDVDRIKEAFNNYISEYDKTNNLIEAKYRHSINVANNAINIGRSIGLDDEGRYLAYVIGILHDIGSFDQISQYNTLEDSEMVDHANYGVQLLENGVLRQFVHENKYDQIILKVVSNHNKPNIDPSYTEDEKLYCAIIRDADKIDTFSALSEGEYKDYYNVNKDMQISTDVINEINKKHQIDRNLVNNNLDLVVFKLSMVYDINYPYTLKMVRRNDYLNKYIMLIDTLDLNRITLKKIVDEIYAHIDNRLK